MTKKNSNALLAQDIQYIKEDINKINIKLDTKYVSHETFDLTASAINKAISLIVYVGIFLVTPVYGAIIALLFKVFSQ